MALVSDNLQNIWELYGLKENPFSTSPLLVVGGTIPIDSFVGRKDQIRRLSKLLGSKGGSRTFVYGDVGVGKTSFVNVVRHSAMQAGFFTHFKEIAVQGDWNVEDFILNTISAIYGTLKVLKEKPISESLFKKLESLFEIGKSNLNVGISLGPIGASYGTDIRATEKLTAFSLQGLLQEIIKEITNNTHHNTVIHYNNLELLHETKLRHLFENLRDFFQIQDVHFILVGNLTVHAILQSMPRFSSIITDTPFHIETLTFDEVKEILQKRFNALSLPKEYNVVQPYTEDCLKVLYDLMDGNIRNILNSLATAVLEITQERPLVLDRNMLSKTLKSVLETRYLYKLTPRKREVLSEVVKHREVTNKALSDKLKIPRSNISTYVKDLEADGCVYLKRKNGKDKFWSAEPKIRWSLLKESPQMTLDA